MHNRKCEFAHELTHIKCYRSDSKIESLTHNSCYPRIVVYRGGVTDESTVKKRIYGNYLASIQKNKDTCAKVRTPYRALHNL